MFICNYKGILIAFLSIISSLAIPITLDNLNCDSINKDNIFNLCNCNAYKYLKFKSDQCDIIEQYRIGSIYYGCATTYCTEVFGKSIYTYEGEEGPHWSQYIAPCLSYIADNLKRYTFGFTDFYFQISKEVSTIMNYDYVSVSEYGLNWFNNGGKNSDVCANINITIN